MKGSRVVVRRTVEYRSTECKDMPRKSLDIRHMDYPSPKKRCSLFLPSGEDGFGQSPYGVKGLAPCRFSGQSPEPSGSFGAAQVQRRVMP